MYKLTGGFGSYLFGMSARIAQQSADSSTSDTKEPGLLWFIGFLFVVSFLGLFSVVPLRKVLNKLIRTLMNQLFQHALTSKDNMRLVSDHDHRLQIDISKWHCNCLSYQQFPHSSRSQASQVTPSKLIISKLFFIYFMVLI